jgi:hypothetical protein
VIGGRGLTARLGNPRLCIVLVVVLVIVIENGKTEHDDEDGWRVRDFSDTL